MTSIDPLHPDRIVVGWDGSPAAEAALAWAAATAASATAEGRETTVRLVHVMDADPNAGLPLEVQGRAEAAAGAAASAAAAEHGAVVEASVVQGRPWEAIVEAGRTPGTLIVVGRRGEGTHHRHRLGRTPDRIVRMAHGPVLVMPAEGVPADARFRRILVGIDFSPDSDAALDAAAAICGPGGTIVAVHACPPPITITDGPVTPLPDLDMDAIFADARAGLERRLSERVPDDRTTVIAVSPLPPALAIEEVAAAQSVDLVAVGTRGRTGLARLLMGSVAERTLHHVEGPVLVVHAAPDGEGRA